MKIHSFETTYTNNLIPVQQVRSARKTLRNTDCYQQRFVKFDDIGIFHSYAEYLHAALLESDIDVSIFTPKPFKLKVGSRNYIPDCYFVKGGDRYVVEIKPKGELSTELETPLREYFNFKGINFNVTSNESIFEREILGQNWIQIIQTLVSSRFENTDTQEREIWEKLHIKENLSIGDFIDSGHRLGSMHNEIALFRLAHSGKIHLDLESTPVNFETCVSLCG